MSFIVDTEVLFQNYEPLRKAIVKKFSHMMHNNSDREDLFNSINLMFVQLVNEYNPRRGVDFPYYIKKMLEFRVYHHINKYLRVVNKETCEDDFSSHDAGYFEKDIQHVLDMMSIDPNIVLGEKHRNLMIGTIIDKKTLKELADEEGISVNKLHARSYFLGIKYLKEYNRLIERYGPDLY